MRYFTQLERPRARSSMNARHCHRGTVRTWRWFAQTCHMPAQFFTVGLVDQVEGNYLGEMLNGTPGHASMSRPIGPQHSRGVAAPASRTRWARHGPPRYIRTTIGSLCPICAQTSPPRPARQDHLWSDLTPVSPDDVASRHPHLPHDPRGSTRRMFEAGRSPRRVRTPAWHTRSFDDTVGMTYSADSRQLLRRLQELRARTTGSTCPGKQGLGLRTRHRTRRSRLETGAQ